MAEGGGGESRAELREGQFLLGMPTFEETANGRFRCVETGHELSSRDMIESYGRSKGCRLALIDSAVKNLKPPLNMFLLDPLSKSKLVCKLTGDLINKSEEHIWKHITGKKFQRKLDQEEEDKKPLASNGATRSNSTKVKSKGGNVAADDVNLVSISSTAAKTKDDISEGTSSEEPDFWVPPVGSRWDFDSGKDRWEISAALMDEVDPEDETISAELSTRTKRISASVGPANSAPRKKKSRKKD